LSLSAIAPVEKTENLIYAILPVSLGLLIGSILFDDSTLWLSTLAIVSPIFTILLYEIAPDEKRIEKQFRTYLVNEYSRHQKDFFNCNLFIRTWESTLQTYDVNIDIIKADHSDFSNSVVSSYSARRHFWRLRATWYVMISVPMLAGVALRTIDVLYRDLTVPIVGNWWPTILGICWILLSCAIVYPINRAKKKRFQDTEEFLESYITYQYWHTMIASDTVRTPDEYNPGSIKGIVKSELNALDVILARNDWDVFMQRWNRLNRNIMNLADVDFKNNFQSYAYELWGSYIFLNRKKKPIEIVKRQIEWFLYYSKGAGLIDSNADLLKRMTSLNLAQLLNSNLILERLPQLFLTREREVTEQTRRVVAGLNKVFNGSSGDLSQAVRSAIQELHKPEGIGLDRIKLAGFVMQYVVERHELGMDSFLKGYALQPVLYVFGLVQHRSNSVWLLVDWFQECSVSEMANAVHEDLLKDILLKPPLKSIILNRTSSFRGDYREHELKILKTLSSRLHQVGDREVSNGLDQIYDKIMGKSSG
jgi:hypothetical protein